MSSLSTLWLLQYGQQSAQRTQCIDLYSPQYPTCNARCVKPLKIIKFCWTYNKFAFLISLACILTSFPGVDIYSIVGTYFDENCAPHASFQSHIAEIVNVQYSVFFLFIQIMSSLMPTPIKWLLHSDASSWHVPFWIIYQCSITNCLNIG